ncbi:MAG: hypothetical protein MUC76_08890 [Spirochaetes bacterium]|jgi:hypothetical protein|nr:hypothetical protein [Spirochaetota bacterium]
MENDTYVRPAATLDSLPNGFHRGTIHAMDRKAMPIEFSTTDDLPARAITML